MEINKSDRATLKRYFTKNAVPTEGNFVELIDGVVNQKEDGLAKQPGEPLGVRAEGGEKKALGFYNAFTADAQPLWTLSLNPYGAPGNPQTARQGLNIAGPDGASRLFIDQATGNVGLGTMEPGGYRLNVNGPALITGDYLFVNSESAGALRVGAAWGKPGLYAGAGKSLALGADSGQKVYFGADTGDAFVEAGTGNAWFKGNVGIGAESPENKLQLGGHLHMNGNSIFLRGENPKDQFFVVKWNKAGDRVDVGGFNGVALGYTKGSANSVNAVLSVDNAGVAKVSGGLQVSGGLLRKVAIATGLGPNDGTQSGQIKSRVLTFTKLYDETAIRILYCDNLRVNGNDCAGRWEIRIDGASAPGGKIFQDRYGNTGNYHEHTTFLGFATGVKAGSRRIEVWVGPAEHPRHGDLYTGWNNSRWTIEAQEVWI